MPGNSDPEQDIPSTLAELYFLIAKFLSSGPCTKAAEVLRGELEEHKLLPRRTDWLGVEHLRTYDNLVDVNRHIQSTHLLQIVQRIGPLLEKDVKPIVRGVTTLLGAGRQSLLRSIEGPDVRTVKWPNRTFVACRYGRPLQPPKNLRHHPNLAVIHHASQLSGCVRARLACGSNMYNKMSLMSRSLGHLSAVYCVAFDRTGNYIITGADDHLIKIWSTGTGRLLATLRGHAAEITDMAVNYENTLLAAGSCDKIIRVWCLRTVTPIAILHAHTGSITSLQFCPIIRGDLRYLLSTGADGCLCFWEWNINTNNFNPKPIKFIERSRAGAQLLCSSFSPGGVFLATGSTDHVVRVFCFTASAPEKICELEAHTDRVDSIQYGSRCDRFVSGSKDGTARIWHYERHEWNAILLDVTQQLDSTGPKPPVPEPDKKEKLRVTMVGWSGDDHYVITAVSDFSLKVWDSYTGQLEYVLKGHTDEVFVLEHNPVDHSIILSAGHDGHIILWDLYHGVKIKSFFNMIEGQGHGAVFDCKWAPDGQTFAATDSHGFSMIFGFGSNELYRRLPEEMFFHTDYRPLIRDANSFVLDEQTQQPPHLMPPPFLVDIDGNPHPPGLQRLVPGRESANPNQLIPQIGITPSGRTGVLGEFGAWPPQDHVRAGPSHAHAPRASGDREVLDLAIGDIQENAEEADPPGPSGEGPAQPDAVGVGAAARNQRVSIDDMIQRMQREQDQRMPAAQSGRSPRAEAPMSPPHNRGPRRSGEVEGVRQSSGNVPMSQRATARDLDAWSRRVVVRELDPAVARYNADWRKHVAEEEIKKFVSEKKKKPLPSAEGGASEPETSYMKTRRRKTTGGSSRTRRGQAQEAGRNRLTTRALYDTEEEEVEEESGHETEAESDPDMWNSNESSEGDSSEYSDWTADAGVTLQPPKRTSLRKPKKKRFSSSEEEVDEEYDDEPRTPTPKKPKLPPKSKRERRAQQRKQRVLSQQQIGETRELPEEFRPPEWLTDTMPRKAPYFPQMGDEVIYFRQGHMLYNQAIKRRKLYDINPSKNQPWHKVQNLREHELVKIVGIRYEVRPPRIVCLKLARIDPDTSKLLGGSFTVKYHDMPDVIDFIVLRQTYNTAIQRNWKTGDRFRCLIDESWWLGTIDSQEPLHPEFPDSLFQCFNVAWDNGESEKMSPWDLEPLDENRMPVVRGGSVAVIPEELKNLLYRPSPTEWPAMGQEAACERIIRGMEQIMELSIAEHFLAPVDLNVFPIYAIVIEYPIDLSTINARLQNRFYRRVTSIQHDVRYLETNAAKFNEPNSKIVKCARLLTELLLRFISNHESTDPMSIYVQLTRDVDFALGPVSHASNGEGTSHDAGNKTKQSTNCLLDPNNWKKDVCHLTEVMIQCEDSEPFRTEVNPLLYPDYREIVATPMDLSLVQSNVAQDVYDSPIEYCKDVRLIFNNSRAYNTNKRSKIYAMTLRLSAMFEDLIINIISDWKASLKCHKSGKILPGVKRRFSLQHGQPTSGPSRGASTSTSILPGENSSSSRQTSTVAPRATSSTPATRGLRSRGSWRQSLGSSRRETRQTKPTVKRKREESSNSETEVEVDSEATVIDSGEDSEYDMKRMTKPKKKKVPTATLR